MVVQGPTFPALLSRLSSSRDSVNVQSAALRSASRWTSLSFRHALSMTISGTPLSDTDFKCFSIQRFAANHFTLQPYDDTPLGMLANPMLLLGIRATWEKVLWAEANLSRSGSSQTTFPMWVYDWVGWRPARLARTTRPKPGYSIWSTVLYVLSVWFQPSLLLTLLFRRGCPELFGRLQKEF